MKNGIAKYLKEKCDIDTKKDPAFSSSAAVFSAVVTDLKKKGLGGTEHKPVICREDLVKLYSPSNIALNPDSPSGLLHKVWFDAMTYLCRRGRENLREMTRHTFTVAVDGSGRRFVAQVCTLSIEVFLVLFWFCTTFLKKKITVVIIIFSIHWRHRATYLHCFIIIMCRHVTIQVCFSKNSELGCRSATISFFLATGKLPTSENPCVNIITMEYCHL